MKRYLPLVCLVAAFVAFTAGAFAQPADNAGTLAKPDIEHWQLDNGLEVLFLADHRAPVVAIQLFYHVGSKDDPPHLRGIAHLFEHMMFKGSQHLRAQEHARFLNALGGQINAFTLEDLTAYTEAVPSEHLRFALRLEAERMRNLMLTRATVSSEREIVKEEKRLRVDSNPMGKTLELFSSVVFTAHPYGGGPTSDSETLDRVTPADCQRFYDTYYVPNNATLVVVGSTTEEEVRRLVAQEFGAVPRGPAVPRITAVEPPQTALREKSVELEVVLPFIWGGYHIPEATHADIPALKVVAKVLFEGQTSRLYRRLVQTDRVALAAGGFARVLEQPGVLLIFASYLPTIDQKKVRAALLEEMERVQKDGITEKELKRAKSQLTMAYLSQLETVEGIANALGMAQYVYGGWEKFGELLDQYERVTPADVVRVTQRYLSQDNLTLVSLTPTQSRQGARQ